MVAMSEGQLDHVETDIGGNIEKSNQIVSADRHRLPGSIQDRVCRNADGASQNNHAAAGECHVTPSRQRGFQAGLVAIHDSAIGPN